MKIGACRKNCFAVRATKSTELTGTRCLVVAAKYRAHRSSRFGAAASQTFDFFRPQSGDPQSLADPQSGAHPQSLADPQSGAHPQSFYADNSRPARTDRHEFSCFFTANGARRARIVSTERLRVRPRLRACHRLRVRPVLRVTRLRVPKFSIFFRPPRDPRLATLNAAQRGPLRPPRQPSGTLLQTPTNTPTVRV